MKNYNFSLRETLCTVVVAGLIFYLGFNTGKATTCDDMEIILEEGSIQNTIENQFGAKNLKEFLAVCNF
ncbi:MAG: hypothetical protein RLZZ480_295 [Candidatus Parcubacteria bacterium]